jgi:hypothetical protein
MKACGGVKVVHYSSLTLYLMEVNYELHYLAVILLEKETTVPVELEVGWASE